ncbi:MAG: FliG C-terminal domain-containing protein [Elusimicrobiota bacterium]
MRFGLLALLLAAMPPSAAGAVTQAPEAERIEQLLGDLLGRDKARVYIVRETRTVDSPVDIPERKIDMLWDRWEQRAQDLPPVLPGYRIPRSLRDEIHRTLQADAPAPKTRTEEFRTVTLVLDPSVLVDESDRARGVVEEVLGLVPTRGDTLSVVRAPIHARKSEAALRAKLLDCMLYAATAAVLLLLAFILFRPRRQASPPEAAPRGKRRAAPPLALLAPQHVRGAVELLDKEPARSAVQVLRKASPEVAADIFRRLAGAKRLDAARLLLAEPAVGAPPPNAIEARVLAAVGAHEAGEGLLERLLLRAPESVRREILSELYKAFPERVRRLKSRLVSMPDLAAAEPNSLRTCLAAFSCEDIALSLYDAPEDSRAAFLNALPDTVRYMVQERLKYMVPESYDQVHRARADLYTRWKRLETYGRVSPLPAAREA